MPVEFLRYAPGSSSRLRRFLLARSGRTETAVPNRFLTWRHSTELFVWLARHRSTTFRLQCRLRAALFCATTLRSGSRAVRQLCATCPAGTSARTRRTRCLQRRARLPQCGECCCHSTMRCRSSLELCEYMNQPPSDGPFSRTATADATTASPAPSATDVTAFYPLFIRSSSHRHRPERQFGSDLPDRISTRSGTPPRQPTSNSHGVVGVVCDRGGCCADRCRLRR